MVKTQALPRLLRNEDGAETLQLALCVPMLIVLIMGVVQLCVMAFFTLTLAGEVNQAAWETDLTLLARASSSDSDAHVKDLILRRSVHLDESRLQVENTHFTEKSPYSYRRSDNVARNRTVYSEGDHERFVVRQLYQEARGGLVEFDVSYRLPSIINLPGLSDVTITRHVAHERLVSTRTEIR